MLTKGTDLDEQVVRVEHRHVIRHQDDLYDLRRSLHTTVEAQMDKVRHCKALLAPDFGLQARNSMRFVGYVDDGDGKSGDVDDDGLGHFTTE